MKKLLCAFLILSVVGCKDKDQDHTPAPANVLSQNQFAKVLVDFSLAESASNLNVKALPINKTDSAYAFDPLLENNVRKSQYDSTLEFYAAHPIQYRAVYDTVLAILDKLKMKRQQVLPAPPKK